MVFRVENILRMEADGPSEALVSEVLLLVIFKKSVNLNKQS